MTKKDMAKVIGCTTQTYSKKEIGKSILYMAECLDVCDYFGIGLLEFREMVMDEMNKEKRYGKMVSQTCR